MLVTSFLKRLSYKDLKTVKTLKIQQGSAKIWRLKVRKKSITKWRIFQIFKHHIFALLWHKFLQLHSMFLQF